MEGWVKLHRKFIDWEWYSDINVKVLFLHLLLVANHEDAKYKGNFIKRGQKLTSVSRLAEETKLTVKQVRIALDKLKMTNEIVTERAKLGTLITIVKYDFYQGTQKNRASKRANNEANKGQNEGKARAKNKNDNNDNNNIYIYFINKYKSNEKSFKKQNKIISQMRKDEKWEKLTQEEKLDLQTAVFK